VTYALTAAAAAAAAAVACSNIGLGIEQHIEFGIKQQYWTKHHVVLHATLGAKGNGCAEGLAVHVVKAQVSTTPNATPSMYCSV
jgi:hypothetical protein